MILNLHGLYGKAINTNYGILTSSYPSSDIYAPQISLESRAPSDIVKELLEIPDIDFIVGNSFGGFFAYVVSAELGCPCLLTNPCIPPTKYISALIPEYPKKFLDQLDKFTSDACTKKFTSEKCDTYIILGTEDEVLDSEFTEKYLKNVEIHKIHGNHRLKGTEYSRLFEMMTEKLSTRSENSYI